MEDYGKRSVSGEWLVTNSGLGDNAPASKSYFLNHAAVTKMAPAFREEGF